MPIVSDKKGNACKVRLLTFFPTSVVKGSVHRFLLPADNGKTELHDEGQLINKILLL